MVARKSDAEDSTLSASATVEELVSVVSEALEASAPEYRAFRKATTEHEAEAVAQAIIRNFQVAPRPRRWDEESRHPEGRRARIVGKT